MMQNQTQKLFEPAKVEIFVLTQTNWYPWEKVAVPYLKKEGYENNLKYESFTLFCDSNDHTKTRREILFNSLLAPINSKKLTTTFTQEHKLKEIAQLSSEFIDIDKKIGADEADWKLNESKLKGLLESLVDESIWLAARDQPSCGLIWKAIKAQTQHSTPGNRMALLNEFFNSTQQQGETLTAYHSRVVSVIKKLDEIGQDKPTWNEIQCLRVLTGIDLLSPATATTSTSVQSDIVK